MRLLNKIKEYYTLVRTDSGETCSVSIHESVKLGDKVSIEHGVTIGRDTTIGDFVKLGKDAYIQVGCVIKDNACIHEQANIGTACKIGERTHVGSSTRLFAHCIVGNDVTMHQGVYVSPYVMMEDYVHLDAWSTIPITGITLTKGTRVTPITERSIFAYTDNHDNIRKIHLEGEGRSIPYWMANNNRKRILELTEGQLEASASSIKSERILRELNMVLEREVIRQAHLEGYEGYTVGYETKVFKLLKHSNNPEHYVNIVMKDTGDVHEVYIHETAKLGNNIKIGKNVKIGKDCIILKNVSLGDNVEITNESIIRQNVKIGNDVQIGYACVLDDGAVLEDTVSLGAQVFVGESSRVKESCIIQPLVNISPNTITKEGIVIAESL